MRVVVLVDPNREGEAMAVVGPELEALGLPAISMEAKAWEAVLRVETASDGTPSFTPIGLRPVQESPSVTFSNPIPSLFGNWTGWAGEDADDAAGGLNLPL